jgi:hypothetical protein
MNANSRIRLSASFTSEIIERISTKFGNGVYTKNCRVNVTVTHTSLMMHMMLNSSFISFIKKLS